MVDFRSNLIRQSGEIAIQLPTTAIRGKCLGFAAILLTLGGLTGGGHASAQSITDRQERMFASFYFDSIRSFVEVAGDDLLNMPMEEFQVLPEMIQHSACLMIVDHMTFRSALALAFSAAHGRERMIEFMKRSRLSRESQPFLSEDVKSKFDTISDKSRDCLVRRVVSIDRVRFTDGHVAAQREFQLRALYESQVPFVQWVWRTVPPSEERNDLESVIRTMERKYLLDIADP